MCIVLKVVTASCFLCNCSILTADKTQLQTQLADVEALRIMPLYKSIDSLTADIAARDDSIVVQQVSIAALQAQLTQLEEGLEVKRSKKRAYKTAFTGKVSASSSFIEACWFAPVERSWSGCCHWLPASLKSVDTCVRHDNAVQFHAHGAST